MLSALSPSLLRKEGGGGGEGGGWVDPIMVSYVPPPS